jgi:hypothetical protein
MCEYTGRNVEINTVRKRTLFWDVAPYRLVEIQHFRGTYCFHHQGDDSSSANLYETTGRNTPENNHLPYSSEMSLDMIMIAMMYVMTVTSAVILKSYVCINILIDLPMASNVCSTNVVDGKDGPALNNFVPCLHDRFRRVHNPA